jgi:hypothetical protein
MKKKINLTFVGGLFAITLFFIFSGCKKDSSNELDITGKWVLKYPHSQSVTLYEFKSNHTFEYSMVTIDSVTKEVIGIASKTVGKYQVKNQQLNFYDRVVYQNKSNQFGSAAELVVNNNSDRTGNYTIAKDDKNNTLSMFFTCPLNADCVPSPMVYYKQ